MLAAKVEPIAEADAGGEGSQPLSQLSDDELDEGEEPQRVSELRPLSSAATAVMEQRLWNPVDEAVERRPAGSGAATMGGDAAALATSGPVVASAWAAAPPGVSPPVPPPTEPTLPLQEQSVSILTRRAAQAPEPEPPVPMVRYGVFAGYGEGAPPATGLWEPGHDASVPAVETAQGSHAGVAPQVVPSQPATPPEAPAVLAALAAAEQRASAAEAALEASARRVEVLQKRSDVEVALLTKQLNMVRLNGEKQTAALRQRWERHGWRGRRRAWGLAADRARARLARVLFLPPRCV